MTVLSGGETRPGGVGSCVSTTSNVTCLVVVLPAASVAWTVKTFSPSEEVSIGLPLGTVPAQVTAPGALSSQENEARWSVLTSYFWAFGLSIATVGSMSSPTV